MDSYRMKSDVKEICRLMEEAFGWTAHEIIPCESTLDSFRHAGSAAVNIVIRDEALPAAKILEERCETPYVTGMPYGYQGTLKMAGTGGCLYWRICFSKLIADIQEEKVWI
ncbi:MAG: nitrogenase component 1 [Eubacteriales bacterium]